MISARSLRQRATISRASETISETGAVTQTWTVIAVGVPCTRQPMSEKLRRVVPGDIALKEAFFACNAGVDIRLGDRVEVDAHVDRVEALHDAAGRGHHFEAGLVALREDG